MWGFIFDVIVYLLAVFGLYGLVLVLSNLSFIREYRTETKERRELEKKEGQ